MGWHCGYLHIVITLMMLRRTVAYSLLQNTPAVMPMLICSNTIMCNTPMSFVSSLLMGALRELNWEAVKFKAAQQAEE